jgi:acid phosphatase
LREQICKDFSKKKGRPERVQYEKHFTKPIRKRFNKALPGLKLKSGDIVAMLQLCGYETTLTGSTSPFCALFGERDFLDFEYSNDLH